MMARRPSRGRCGVGVMGKKAAFEYLLLVFFLEAAAALGARGAGSPDAPTRGAAERLRLKSSAPIFRRTVRALLVLRVSKTGCRSLGTRAAAPCRPCAAS